MWLSKEKLLSINPMCKTSYSTVYFWIFIYFIICSYNRPVKYISQILCSCHFSSGSSVAVAEAMKIFQKLMGQVKQRPLYYKEELHKKWLSIENLRAPQFAIIEERTKCTIHLVTDTLPKKRTQQRTLTSGQTNPQPLDPNVKTMEVNQGLASSRLAPAVVGGVAVDPPPAIAYGALAAHKIRGVYLLVFIQ